MSLVAPWALVGLITLPLMWWLHKRLRRPPEVQLPSLMFLHDEAEARTLPRGKRIDAELLLALASAACLALAAAGPVIEEQPERRVVRVVVSGGAPLAGRGRAEALANRLREIKTALGPADVLQTQWVGGLPSDAAVAPRPSTGSLLDAARAGEAALRVVISDREPPPEPGEIRWVGLGATAADNLAVVATSTRVETGGTVVFFTVTNHGRTQARVSPVLEYDGTARPAGELDLAPGASGSREVRVPTRPADLALRLRDGGGGALDDALAADDVVRLVRRDLLVYVHAALPGALRERIRHALGAALGDGGVRYVERAGAIGAHLAFVARAAELDGTALRVVLGSAPPGHPVVRALPGRSPLGRHPVVQDLTAAGTDWVYARGDEEAAPGEEPVLVRRADVEWPIVLLADRQVRLAPDPLRGTPRPVDTAFWPLWIENLAHAAGGGAAVGAGYRAQGLLDDASSRLGTHAGRFDPAWIAASEPSVAATGRPLRPLLICAAFACLGLLWALPRIRRRIGKPQAQRAKTHASPA